MALARKRTYQAEFLNYGFTDIEDKGQIKPQCVNASMYESTDCRVFQEESTEETWTRFINIYLPSHGNTLRMQRLTNIQQ